MKTKLFLIAAIVASVLFFSCKETITEYQNPPSPKPSNNDQYHGDLVGKIKQAASGAVVILSQVNVVDSVPASTSDGAFIFRGVQAGNYDITIRAANYRIYSRSNVIIEGGGVAYLGEVDLSSTPDLIAAYYPADRAEIVYDNRYARLSISFLFTQPMDRASVEKAFSTNPPSKGIFYWGSYAQTQAYALYDSYNGSFAAVDKGAVITTYSRITSVTYTLSRKDSYVDTAYTFTLSTEAKDTSGNHLRFPLVSTFSTIESQTTVYGIQTDPIDGDIDIPPLSPQGITITFPRRMDPATTEAALTVSPNDLHYVLWPGDGNVMNIYFGGVYRADSTYSVLVDSTATDRDGNKLGERVAFSFHTAPVEVTSTSPRNGEVFVASSAYLSLNFSTYVVLASVQAAFSITPNVPGTFIRGNISGSGYPKNMVTFLPSASYLPNTLYKVTISKAARDLYDKTMDVPYTFSFVTQRD